MKRQLVFLLFFFISLNILSQRKLTVQADKIINKYHQLRGEFFSEDINFAADGGIYAEMVKNGSFEFPMPMMGWSQKLERWEPGRTLVINRSDNSANSNYARLSNSSQSKINEISFKLKSTALFGVSLVFCLPVWN